MDQHSNFDAQFPAEANQVLALRFDEIPQEFKSTDVVGFRFDDPSNPQVSALAGFANREFTLSEMALALRDFLNGKIHLVAEGLNFVGVNLLVNAINEELRKGQQITREKVLMILSKALIN